jgi:hypothetical protein
METNDIKLLKKLTESARLGFSMLKPHSHNNNKLEASIGIDGYQELMFLITDLIKVSLLALEAEDPSQSDEIRNPNSNIAGVLALVLQLIPYEELQMLDILHKHHLKNQQQVLSGKVDDIAQRG